MTIKQLIIILAILILTLFGISFYKNHSCKGCDNCEYEGFTDHVMVEKIVCKNDSMCTIHLKSLTKNYTYQIYPDEFTSIETDFDKKEITDTMKSYSIYGEMISQGTCEPYGINKMLLDKK